MGLLTVVSRHRRTATPGALVIAGLVVGLLSGIALATPGSGLTTSILAVWRSDEIKTGASNHKIRIDTRRARPVPSLRSAGRFLLAEVEQKASGDWATAWQSLYPLHQRIAPRDTFIRCETATPFPAPLESIHVVHVRATPVHVAGVLHPVPGVEVTVAVELRWYGPRDPITFTHAFHLVPVQGRWKWLLSPDRYRLYLRDACFAEPAI